MGSNSTTTPSTVVDILSDPTAKHSVDTNIIEVGGSFGWTALEGDPENSGLSPLDDSQWSDNTGVVVLFHFTPAPDRDGTIQYVSQCSGRGKCNKGLGSCECFDGYTGLDCSIQNVLAKYSHNEEKEVAAAAKKK